MSFLTSCRRKRLSAELISLMSELTSSVYAHSIRERSSYLSLFGLPYRKTDLSCERENSVFFLLRAFGMFPSP